MHYTTPKFWKCYEALPQNIREVADRNYELSISWLYQVRMNS